MAERERLEIEARSNWSLLQGLEQASREFDAATADIKQVVALTGDKLEAGRATFIHHLEARQSALDAEFELLNNRLRLEEVRIDLLRVLGGPEALSRPWAVSHPGPGLGSAPSRGEVDQFLR